jgi:hypothetical protein
MALTPQNVGNVLPADGLLKRIHVNQNLLRKAIKGEDVCPYIVQYKGRSWPAKEIEASGHWRAVNRVANPLSCGARLFIETKDRVVVYT